MSSARGRRPKSFLKRFLTAPRASSPTVTQEASVEPVNLVNPIDAYYRHKAQNNLRALYRFAIQSRSLAIRDVFAKASSNRNLDLAGLLSAIDHLPLQALSDEEREALAGLFDSSILLALADLLANTARDDLDTYAAVKIYDFVHQIYGEEPFSKQQILLYVEALNDAGMYEQSDLLAEKYAVNDIAPLQREFLNLQRVRKTSSCISDWTETLNELYAALGLTQIRLLDDETVPYMDRLAASGGEPINGPKVSVIMPTFSPGPAIRTAVRSLLEQTWQNLEVIIVDDASPSEYRHIFDELAHLDPRIRVLHQQKNQGAYVARNAGLDVATGEYVTTADDDDWSHPDKIASQISVMLDAPSVVATTSGHIRTTENLELRRLNSSAKYLQMNYSSLMFRKQIIEEIGGWDTVNRGADSEFYSRLTDYYGSDRIVRLLDKPLGLSRVRTGSLTAGEMYRGFIGTPRVLYLWAIRQWRWDLGKIGQKPIRTPNAPRPYAVPSNFEAGQRHRDLGLFDVVYVTDFFRHAKYVDFVVNELETLVSAGFRVGYMHLYSPETTRPEGFPKRLFELQLQGKVTQLSHDDRAETKLLLVYDLAIGAFADQLRSTLVSHRSVVIQHTLPRLSATERRTPSYAPQALLHLDESFGTTFQVVGATIEDQVRLRQSMPNSRLLPDEMLWKVHLRDNLGKIVPPTRIPVVGFHSYGNKYRWPNNVEQFNSVYVSPDFRTKLFGQLEIPRNKFGSDALDSVELLDMDECDEQDFLCSIDYWVYWPHSRLHDQIWEPVLRAMCAGKVVILPKRLAGIYGDAALYAETNQISTLISQYTRSPESFRQQAERGQKFVQEGHTNEDFIGRIVALMTHKNRPLVAGL